MSCKSRHSLLGLRESLLIPLNCLQENRHRSSSGWHRREQQNVPGENLRYACRAGCKADRAPGSGTQQCSLAGQAGTAHAGRYALQLPAPLRRLLTAQADQKSVLWRTGHRNRYDPERSHTANSRRQGIHRRGHHQRWHWRSAPVFLQPALDGEPLQARGCHFESQAGSTSILAVS